MDVIENPGPLALAIGFVAQRNRTADAPLWTRMRATVPWFVLGFAGTAALRTAGVVPAQAIGAASLAGGFLILMVLVAVGLNVDIRKLARLGTRPLAVGFGIALAMALVSLGLIHALRIG